MLYEFCISGDRGGFWMQWLCLPLTDAYIAQYLTVLRWKVSIVE